MFGFGKKKKKREEEARRAAEAQAAADAARLAEEMKRAEEMRRAEAEKRAAAAKQAQEAQKAEAAKQAQEAQKAEAEQAAEAQAEADEEIAEEAVKSNGKFEIKRTNDGRFMFNVRAGNTQIIASSQVYSAMSACKNGIASVGANAPIAAIEDQTLQTINEEKCPKFQIYFDKAGKYRFNLIATNGNNILSCTQGYAHKSSCKNGIKSVINNAAAPTEILKTEK